MSPLERQYFEALNRARNLLRGSAGVLPALLEDLAGVLARLLVKIDLALASGSIPDNLRPLLAEIGRASAEASLEAEALVSDSVSRVFSQVHSAHDRAYANVASSLGILLSASILSSAGENQSRAYRRRGPFGANRPEAMVRNVFVSWNGAVDRFIRANVGTPRREAALRVLSAFDRYPEVHRALQQIGPRGEAVRRSVVRAGRALTTIEDPARNLYANARRVLAHEVNSAFHEADTLAAASSPAVDLVKWHTSERHDSLPSSPDICDVLEDADLHGFGPGVYFPETTPSLPHPYCQDYITPLLRPPASWGSPKRTPVAPVALDAKAVSRILANRQTENSGIITPRALASITGHAKRAWEVAHDAYVDY